MYSNCRHDSRERAPSLYRAALSATVYLLAACGVLASTPPPRQLAELSEEHRTWLERDVVYIITDREREVFLSLESLEERDRFIEAFWKRRDPNRSTAVNEFQVEHYRRIDYANQFLGRETFREGWQTDRGRYYIILGAPIEVQRYEGYNQIVSSELWFYQGDRDRRLPAQFYLLFFRDNDLGEYTLYRPAVDGPRALLRLGRSRPGLTDVQALEELRVISVELARASLSFETNEPTGFGTARRSTGTELLLANIEESPKRAIDAGYLDAWLMYGNRVSADYSFNFVPSRSVFVVLPGPERTPVVHFSVEIDASNFALETDEDRSKFYSTLELTVEARTSEGVLVLAQDSEVSVELLPSQMEQVQALPFAYQGSLPLIPGDYTVTVILRNRVLRQYTVAERELTVPPFRGSTPALSDIVLGFDYESVDDGGSDGDGKVQPFRLGALRVEPAAEHLFAVGDTAFLLTRAVAANPDYRVQFELRDGDRVLRSVEAPVSDDGVVLESLTLDELTGGNYLLTAELRSPSGATLSQRSTPLTVSPRSVLVRPGFTYRHGFDASVPGVMALARGQQLWSLDRFDEARRELEEAVSRGGRQLPVAWWRLAYAYLRDDEPDRALELLVPMEQPFPNHYEVIAGLGLAYHMRQDYARCVDYLTRARTIRPPDTRLLNALGDAFRSLSNLEGAREAYQRSLEIEPDQEAIRRALDSLGGDTP